MQLWHLPASQALNTHIQEVDNHFLGQEMKRLPYETLRLFEEHLLPQLVYL
jgi:hypothetical protein